MFGRQDHVLEALTTLSEAVGRLSVVDQGRVREPQVDNVAEARIGALERDVANLKTTLATIAAEADATLIRAESVFKAARAAEERRRHSAKAGSGPGEIDEDITKEQLLELLGGGVSPIDVEGGEPEPVPPLHPVVVEDAGDAEERELRSVGWGA